MQPAISIAPRLVIFDLDGVVYRGDRPIPGAAALVAAMHGSGIAVRFATNNSMATRPEYADRLNGMGIAATAAEVVTSTSATIDHLHAHLPEVHRVLAVGAPGMVAELRSAGFIVTPVADAAPTGYHGGSLPERYDAVICGLDQEIDYRRIAIAATAIRDGARFVATNADARYPVPEGFLPGAGAVVAAIRVASRVEPLVIGKPEPAMFTTILDEAGVSREEALVIGDNPDADIVAARRAGIRSVLVLTGVADAETAEGLEGERRPDWVAADPPGLADLLGLVLS
ncbi:MAG: HAD-IIA family hydrolase [Chloroflexota bacterium]|nr:HAD-IIA family hydrolase [Chloroflexota bacterium]